jgi:hypothetical protein
MGIYVLKWDILKTTTSTGVPFGKFRMVRKSNHLMERVYAHLSKNGCRKSGLLANQDLTDTLFRTYTIFSSVLRTRENFKKSCLNREINSIFRQQSIECPLHISHLIQLAWGFSAYDQRLAHLSWKLKWAFLIARCQSVCPSVNFSHFDFFFLNHWANTCISTIFGIIHARWNFKWRGTPFYKGR